jgi:hypothetical protein
VLPEPPVVLVEPTVPPLEEPVDVEDDVPPVAGAELTSFDVEGWATAPDVDGADTEVDVLVWTVVGAGTVVPCTSGTSAGEFTTWPTVPVTGADV